MYIACGCGAKCYSQRVHCGGWYFPCIAACMQTCFPYVLLRCDQHSTWRGGNKYFFPMNLGLVTAPVNRICLLLGRKAMTNLSSVQFSHSVVSDSLRHHESQHARPPCPSPTPRFYSNSCPSSWWCHPAISSSVVPFSSCPNPSQHQCLFQWVSPLHQVAKVLEFQLQHQSFQWTPKTDLL